MLGQIGSVQQGSVQQGVYQGSVQQGNVYQGPQGQQYTEKAALLMKTTTDDQKLNDKQQQKVGWGENQRLRKELKFLDEINRRIGEELTSQYVKQGIHPSKSPVEAMMKTNSLQNFHSMKPVTKQVSQISNQKDGNDYENSINQALTKHPEISYLEPLLIAYDAKIKVLEDSIEVYKEDYRTMLRKTDSLVKDNNLLRTQMEAQSARLINIYDNILSENNSSNLSGNAFLQLEREDMSERINVLTKINNELESSFKRLSAEYERSQKQLSGKVQQQESLENKYRESQNSSKQLIIKYDDMQQNFDEANRQLLDEKNNNEQLASINEIAKEKIKEQDKEINMLAIQLESINENTQSQLEELYKQIEQSQTFRQEKDVELRRALNEKMTAERKADQLIEQREHLDKDLHQYKQDKDQLKRTVEQLELKLDSQKQKEDSSNQQLRSAKENERQAIIERDKAKVREEQYSNTLQSINDKHLQELSELKDQYQKIIEKQQKNISETETQREDDISKLNQFITSLQMDNENIQRESENQKVIISRLQAQVREDLVSVYDQKIQEYEQQILEMEEKLNQNDQFYQDQINSLQIEKQQIENGLKNTQLLMQSLKNNNENLRVENSKQKEENNSIRNQLNDTNLEKLKLIGEIKLVKTKFERNFKTTKDELDRKLTYLQDQLKISTQNEKTLREKIPLLQQTQEIFEQKMKEDYDRKMDELEQTFENMKQPSRDKNK